MKDFKSILFASLVILAVSSQYSEGALTMNEKLTKLREKMQEHGFQAAIIVSEDEHQSEYVAKYDNRRAWISGFKGSSGVAVVTASNAALWTDSRYYLAAEAELDKTYWTLMRASDPGVLSIDQWLRQSLRSGNKVYQNSKFTSISSWRSREDSLAAAGIMLETPLDSQSKPIELVDLIWPSEERPAKPNGPLMIHEAKFAGKSIKQKIDLVIAKMDEVGADQFVVTSLDEIAWLFNMRGTDLPNNPMFYGYAIINKSGKNHKFYLDQSRLTEAIRSHLGSDIETQDYDQVFVDLDRFSREGMKIWVSPMSSYAIYNAVTIKDNLISSRASPVRSLKAVKDKVEIENTRRCQIRDSAARVRHMHWLEMEMKKGTLITEMTSANKLIEFQAQDAEKLFRGVSFGSISAVGKNAAIVHYSTADGENATLTKDKIYLLDAGGQYEDCSTDITRTHHYGTPTKEEIYAYTRVLQGSIELANIVFPHGVYGSTIDVVARSPLWSVGLDYGHGTGHGIGYYLSIHEAPPSTSYNSGRTYDETFVVGMIQSDEPGYYETGKFGIRLETDIEVVAADTPYHYLNRTYLTFAALTWVPFETNLIDPCILTNAQVDWLNKYNKMTREKVGPLLQKDKDVYEYFLAKTAPFKYMYEVDGCVRRSSSSTAYTTSKFSVFATACTALIVRKLFN